MNIFTVNQVNQVYVLKSDSEVVTSANFAKTKPLGTVGVGSTKDGKSLYFKHLGAGGVTRSDLIDVDTIMHIKATPASAMARPLAVAQVSINSEALNSSAPIVGQDYILRLKFQNPIGMSPDSQYWKYGAVHVTSGLTAAKFYAKLALSIAKNMSRDGVQLVKVYVDASGTATEVTADMTLASLSGSYTSILIKEVEQDWILGVKQQKPLVMSIEPETITKSGAEIVWGDVVYNTGVKTVGGAEPYTTTVTSGIPATTSVINSKLVADYEYFFMGERADQYRMASFPDYIPTTYLVDPNYAYGYDIIGIHYAYVGANHSIQKSEKDITFIVPRASTDSTASAVGAKAASLLALIQSTSSRVVRVSGAITDGHTPEFDGTSGDIKDSGN